MLVTESPPELPSTASLTGLTLRVRDLGTLATFYERRVGLELVEQDGDQARLAIEGGLELTLLGAPEAPERPRDSVGLYHWAILLPDRASLAATVHRLREEGARFQGFADHGVSEAVYLADPEGNGIELYRDRAPVEWPREGDEVAMVTEPLELESLLAEADGPAPLAPGTRLGHVHLHVPDLDQAGSFYRSLGLRVRQSTYPGALFLAAGDYHHHVGLNTWAGGRRPPEGAPGLVSYTWEVPAEELQTWRDDVPEEVGVERDGDAWVAEDPAGIEVRFVEGDGR